MTSHELAQLLLKGANFPIVIENRCADDGVTVSDSIDNALLTSRDFRHQQYQGTWNKSWGDCVVVLR